MLTPGEFGRLCEQRALKAARPPTPLHAEAERAVGYAADVREDAEAQRRRARLQHEDVPPGSGPGQRRGIRAGPDHFGPRGLRSRVRRVRPAGARPHGDARRCGGFPVAADVRPGGSGTRGRVMSASPVPTRRLDSSPHVIKWRAARARQEAQRRRGRSGHDGPPAGDSHVWLPRYSWPADRAAIVAAVVATGRKP